MADEKDNCKESETGHNDSVVDSPDIHFEPIVQLAPVDVKTMEENEEEFVKIRAKLFRFDNSADPPEWKERGTGDVKLLRHKSVDQFRLVMRRDKTYKICANHFITKDMELKPSFGSDRAWVWTSLADFADEQTKPELLAIRFANVENAQKFKAKFEEARKIVAKSSSDDSDSDEESTALTEKIGDLKVSSKEEEDDSEKKLSEKETSEHDDGDKKT